MSNQSQGSNEAPKTATPSEAKPGQQNQSDTKPGTQQNQGDGKQGAEKPAQQK